mmetsp:Transcript_51114/g.146761  ORF Transcript_51114/g.146761 Transcript_51114/m.146761 type:complete len:219 (-) Transcript_51114:613-1269(-)
MLHHEPHVALAHRVQDLSGAQRLDHVHTDDHMLGGLGHVHRPQLPSPAVDLCKDAQSLRRVILAKILQECRAVIHEEGRAGRRCADFLRHQVLRVALAQRSSSRHLHVQQFPVVLAEIIEALQTPLGLHLRHAQYSHLGDRRIASWDRTQRRRVLGPTDLQVLLHNLCLGVVCDLLNVLEGAQKAIQDLERKFGDELLATAQGRGLRACQVRQPMHEV